MALACENLPLGFTVASNTFWSRLGILNANTARPQDTRPQGVRTLEIHGFNWPLYPPRSPLPMNISTGNHIIKAIEIINYYMDIFIARLPQVNPLVTNGNI